MVSFLQKNAAKIVIISGAALISTISGGCNEECPAAPAQDSTLSGKCSTKKTEFGADCGTDKEVNDTALCKGKDCVKADYEKTKGTCCKAKPPTPAKYVACITDGKNDATEKTLNANTNQCSLPACDKDKYRVKLAKDKTGCLGKCTGTGRQAAECACMELDGTAVKALGVQTLCPKDHICNNKGVVEFPVCGFADAKYNSNCTSGTGVNAKTCHDWSDGSNCTGTIIKENEIAVTTHAVCRLDDNVVKSDKTAIDGAAKAHKIAMCAKDQICTKDSNNKAKCVALGDLNATCGTVVSTGDATKLINCKYDSGKRYCGKRNGLDYAWDEAKLRCGEKCTKAAPTADTSACVCVNDKAASAKYSVVESCDKLKPACDDDAAHGSPTCVAAR